jgi:hypothetical protein
MTAGPRVLALVILFLPAGYADAQLPWPGEPGAPPSLPPADFIDYIWIAIGLVIIAFLNHVVWRQRRRWFWRWMGYSGEPPSQGWKPAVLGTAVAALFMGGIVLLIWMVRAVRHQ